MGEELLKWLGIPFWSYGRALFKYYIIYFLPKYGRQLWLIFSSNSMEGRYSIFLHLSIVYQLNEVAYNDCNILLYLSTINSKQ